MIQRFKFLVAAIRTERVAAAKLARRSWPRALPAWLGYQQARRERRFFEALIRAQDWDRVAGQAIRDAAWRLDPSVAGPNPFSPRVLARIDEVVAALIGTVVEVAELDDVIDRLPELTVRFTPDAVGQVIRAEVARLQVVAADPVMLTRDTTKQEPSRVAGQRVLTVQHQASGLRARFTYTPGGGGWVYAKPYSMDSIDPHGPRRPTMFWWHEFIGLGIGERIYRHAGVLLPDIRWDHDGLSDHARPLRAKLHAKDPWRWRSPSCGCWERWAELTPETVADAGPHH